jgi:hypothetical protein
MSLLRPEERLALQIVLICAAWTARLTGRDWRH